MAFPDDPLDVVVELEIDGVWTDVTAYAFTRDPVEITRGQSAEGKRLEPSRCELTLNNADGRFSPRNPTSPYFGLLGRNTPLRVSVGADVRFVGEVASWPQRWDEPGLDVWTPLEAAGLTRRLGQGKAVLFSLIRDHIASTGPVAYWPMEDGPASVEAQPAVGAYPFKVSKVASGSSTAPQQFGRGILAPWLPRVVGRLPEVWTMGGRVSMPGFAGTWTVDHMRAGGAGMVTNLFVGTAGTTQYVFVQFDPTVDPAEVIIIWPSGNISSAGTLPEGFHDDSPKHVRLTATQDGADVDYQLWVDGVSVLTDTDTGYTMTEAVSVFLTTDGTVPTVPYSHGHLAVWDDAGPTLATMITYVTGLPGEAAGRRMERLAAAAGITLATTGDLDATAAMGPQGDGTFLDLMVECAEADHGLLFETRAALGLSYTTRLALYAQAAAVELDYSDDVFLGQPEPVDDDQAVRNDVTVSRVDGGSARDVLEAGPLSTAAPPDGVGTYDTSVSVNVETDGTLIGHASWLLALGTIDRARYPRLAFGLHTPPIVADAALSAALAALDVGERLTITGLPSWLPPDDVAALALGFTELLEPFVWTITVNTTPADVYDAIGEFDAARFDTSGSTLNAGIDADDTSLSVLSTGVLWTTDGGAVPFDVAIGGERLTVTAISGSSSPQTFTATRSVNGVAKSHAAGESVRLWAPTRFAL
ncbi:MAG TPA: hypothetical protein VJP77_07805 [Planctomycetota bacterium]|nr:hypothetical protein [Planctomycetota bacterium]